MQRLLGTILALSLLIQARHAGAVERAALDYQAPETCPTRSQFVAEVTKRTSNWIDASDTARRILVRLQIIEGERTKGELSLRENGVVGKPRAIEAKTCEDAARGIAFMTALLIDPVGGTAPTDEVGDVRLPSPSEARDAPPPQQSAVPSRWAAGSRFGLMGLAAPGGVFFFSIFGEWSPAPFFTMRLGAARTLTGTVEAPSASAEMTWTAGQAEICFGHLHKGPLYVHPCLHADVGAVHARAMNEGSVTNIEPKTRPIVLGGLETRLELRTTDALFFEVALLGFASLLRPRFAFRPEVEIYRAPLVGLGGSVGGGLRF